MNVLIIQALLKHSFIFIILLILRLIFGNLKSEIRNEMKRRASCFAICLELFCIFFFNKKYACEMQSNYYVNNFVQSLTYEGIYWKLKMGKQLPKYVRSIIFLLILRILCKKISQVKIPLERAVYNSYRGARILASMNVIFQIIYVLLVPKQSYFNSCKHCHNSLD